MPLPLPFANSALGPFPGDCLASVERVVVDGANRICEPTPHPALAAIAGAALIACALLIAHGGDAARRWLPAIALGCAVPGWWATLAIRADAPVNLPVTARAVSAPLERFRAFGARHTCVDLGDDACVACQPLAQFAFTACDGKDGARATFGAGAFTGVCAESPRELRCPP